LFGFEDINFVERVDPSTKKKIKEWKPLFCLAVSAKRYVLFNRAKNGEPIIRKASAHGLGDVELPTGYKARYDHPVGAIIKDEEGEQLGSAGLSIRLVALKSSKRFRSGH
jgi:hypothetical protein